VNRRDQILETAADLFASKGFHGVSVGEIGRACGISGPALYKHFDSKDAVLAAMLIGISERLLEEGRTRVDQARSPRQALDSLVAWHTDFALRHRSLIVVHLSDPMDVLSVKGTAAAGPPMRERADLCDAYRAKYGADDERRWLPDAPGMENALVFTVEPRRAGAFRPADADVWRRWVWVSP
jgi:AcrR family transcriptional regulator